MEKQPGEPTETPSETPSNDNTNVTDNQNKEQLPTELPRTGYNYYAIFGTVILVISIVVFLIKNYQNKVNDKKR